MSEKQTFRVVLEKHETSEATGIQIPFDVEKIFGAKKVPVSGKINGAKFRSTIFSMGGCYRMAVNKQMRDAANAKAGDTITVEMERDTAPRVIEPTEDLAAALEANSQAKQSWDKLSYTNKKEMVMAIKDAKKPETRTRRIEKAINELLTKFARR
jgi:hypothetical protein